MNSTITMNQPDHSTKNPSDDAHLSLASLDMSSLGQLEDLFSIGSHEQPTSPLAPPGQNTYNPSNAVHMELQENAKLPTFNLSVDRTNSVAAGTKNDLDEIIRLSEKDVNLTEMFLRSRDRSSMNMNYNSAGALLSYIGECFDGDGDSSAKPGSVMSGGSKGFHSAQSPPVPRSVHVPHSNASHVTSPLMSGQANASGPTDSFALANQQTPGQQYPYYRSLPLPIPKRLSLETTTSQSDDTEEQNDNGLATANDALNAALATAAAIASHRKTSAGSHGLPSPSKTAKRSKKSHPDKPSPNSATAKSSRAQYRAGAPPASILDATKQRSQFGFGGNHVVPSVPVPPPARKPKAPPLPTTVSSADAYERKKQKAKESRIKLNESIERTVIAMSVSGTQSNQRAAQLNTIRPTLPALRENTLRTMEECARLAEDAKKWDRPSFVGTAASLIQTLNAQCEALVSEMLEMKKQVGDASVVSLPVSMNEASAQTNNMATSRVTPSPLSNGNSSMQTSTTDETDQSPKRPMTEQCHTHLHSGNTRKRQRLEKSSTHIYANGKIDVDARNDAALAIDTLLSMGPVLKLITGMLDPRSLMHCSRISKTWKDIFLGDATWLQLCIERYGEQNVQQWKDQLEADHLPICTSVKLYRDMDAANVKPYCKHEGSFLLGGACMTGKVSAWVSMVERSNGATYRSVVQESNSQMYSSLPVVELRMLIQNTGSSDFPIVIKEQPITVDASTRRRGEEMGEIHWDDRFHKMLLNLDGTLREPVKQPGSNDIVGELCRLKLFEAVILVVHIHARGCSTTSKFRQKSNFTKLLVKMNGTTVPLVIPFFREFKT